MPARRIKLSLTIYPQNYPFSQLAAGFNGTDSVSTGPSHPLLLPALPPLLIDLLPMDLTRAQQTLLPLCSAPRRARCPARPRPRDREHLSCPVPAPGLPQSRARRAQLTRASSLFTVNYDSAFRTHPVAGTSPLPPPCQAELPKTRPNTSPPAQKC